MRRRLRTLISFATLDALTDKYTSKLAPDAVKAANQERLHHIKRFVDASASVYVLPLYLLFFLADYLYYPQFLIEFYSLRIGAIIALVVVNRWCQRQDELKKLEVGVTVFVQLCAVPISAMVWITGDPGTPYYAGLCLVMLGASTGLRLSFKCFLLNIFLIHLPILALIPKAGFHGGTDYWLNLMFLSGTGLIATVSRTFNEYLVRKEFYARSQLETEVSIRGQIIEQKTREAVDLVGLSKQFSPQVVHAIQYGQLDIKGPVRRSEICVVFVDIVGSTERFLRLDREDLNQILSMYMEDTMSTFLKYDLTIDKFLGDGVLGFSNDPIKHDDYIERALMAASEIKKRIGARAQAYNDLWLNEFQIRIGIASGYASVGFYGSELFFKSYTAIGSCVNLATRLCSVAEPGQILVSQDIVGKIKKRGGEALYQFNEAPSRTLKGFENDQIKLYELRNSTKQDAAVSQGDHSAEICPNGHGILYLDINEAGHYVFRCRQCDFILADEITTKRAA